VKAKRSGRRERGMSLLDQLIGWPGTEEQLRQLTVLFSEIRRVQCRGGEQRSGNGV